MSYVKNVLTGLWHLLGRNTGHDALQWVEQHNELMNDPQALYRLRRMLYDNSWAFRDEASDELILGLRNVTAALVHFYTFTTWPGQLPDALPIETDGNSDHTQTLTSAIHQVWRWSDWQTKKQLYVKTKARDGDALIQIATRNRINADGQVQVDQVYFNLIDVMFITEMDVDHRGFLTWLRLDIPTSRRLPNGKTEGYVETQVWDKATGTQRVWEHRKFAGAQLEDLGDPDRIVTLESMTGTDMIPIVHGKHAEDGSVRGVAAIDHALVKMHEASRMATRLHSMAYQYGEPDMQLVGTAYDPDGRPMSPPRLSLENGGKLSVGRKTFYNPPPGYMVKGVDLSVHFNELLAILQDHMLHIQESDLPQLAYYKLASSSRDLSGEALGHMLKPAVESAIEARSLSEAELVRANQIALTTAIHHGLKGFADQFDMRAYDNGLLDHRFATRDVIPMTARERADVEKLMSEAAVNKQGYGYSDKQLQREAGLTEEEIDRMAAEREATDAERGERLLRMASAGGVDRDV